MSEITRREPMSAGAGAWAPYRRHGHDARNGHRAGGAAAETAALVRPPAAEPPARRPRALARLRSGVDPLPFGLLAAGGAELVAGMRHSGRSRPAGAAGREAAAVHVAHAAALMVSASRQSWRVPLISSVIATRLLGLLGGLAEPTAPGARGIRRGAALALWLAALLGLRAQAARAEAWDAPLVR